jgi:SET domain-containing protein
MKRDILKHIEKTTCRLKPSGTHGVGVFAIKDIPTNVNLFPDHKEEEWFPYSDEELDHLDKEVRTMISDFFTKQNGHTWISRSLNNINVGWFLNHSDTPNVDHDTTRDSFITIKKVKKNEELLIDYNKFPNE